jgi:anti-sigma factor RsiW
MMDHLSPATLSAFADGELSAEQTARAKEHLDECLACASSVIDEWLLKASIGKEGRKYTMPAGVEERMKGLMEEEALSQRASSSRAAPRGPRETRRWIVVGNWAVAASMLVILMGWGIMQFRARQTAGLLKRAALVTEACDLHISVLAANETPQVVSSDRHTVKPWFQGKLPFTFNLPELKDSDFTLIGGRVAYLEQSPGAELIYQIRKHQISAFIFQDRAMGSGALGDSLARRHATFNVESWNQNNLRYFVIGDAGAKDIQNLANLLKQAAQQ